MIFRLAALCLLLPAVLFAADRAAVSEYGTAQIKGEELFTSSTAFVSGVYDYGKGWASLPGVKSDLAQVAETLTAAGFKVISAENLSKAEFISKFESFISKYTESSDARVLIYFAGHGYTVKGKGAGEGYIVLKDAADPKTGMDGFLKGSIPMGYFSEKAKELKAKQVLFIFDSCFAGTVFSALRSVPELVSELLSKPVRQFITSGTEDQMVPDESVFRRRFQDALSGEADADSDSIITGTELGDYLQRAVTAYSAGTQTPVYGKMKGYDGEFLFFRRSFAVREKESEEGEKAAKSEKDELIALIKKNPHSTDAYKAMERLREIDPSLENNPPVTAPERKDFVMTAKSTVYKSFTDDDYPYLVIAPLIIPAMNGGFMAAFRVKAKDMESYKKLNERKAMLKSVMSRRLKESNLQLVDDISVIRERIRDAALSASEWVCPGCVEEKPSIAGLMGL